MRPYTRLPGLKGDFGGPDRTVPATSSHGTRVFNAATSAAGGKFLVQSSSPLHGATAWTLMRCSSFEKSGIGTGRVVRMRLVERGSGCKIARWVVGREDVMVVMVAQFRYDLDVDASDLKTDLVY